MFRVIAVGLLLGLLGGCTRPQIEYLSSSYNNAIANSSDEQLLLNAVRSSLDQRMYFTQVTAFQGNGNFGGSLSPRVPFGPDATRSYDLGLSINANSGIRLIDFGNVNTSKANDDLNKTLEFHTIDRYIRTGERYIFLATLMIEFLEVHERFFDALVRQKNLECNRPGEDKPPSCGVIEQVVRDCSEKTDITDAVLENGERFVTVGNNAGTKCEFLGFQAVLHLLGLSGFGTDTKTTKQIVGGKVIEEEGGIVFFQIEEVQEVYDDVQELLKDIENRFALKIALRSPKSIVAYLGQLIALQNHSADRFVPRILFDDGTSDGIQVAVFRVVRGSKGGERGVLSVRGPDGNDYYVPEPEYGSPGRDQTLRALTIAGELIDAAISEQPLPIPTTAILLP